MKTPKPPHSPDDAALANELARLRSHSFVHDAAVTLYDALPNLGDETLRTNMLEILTVLRTLEQRLDNLKVVGR